MNAATILLLGSGMLVSGTCAVAQGSVPPGWVSRTETFTGVKHLQTRSASIYCPAGTVVTGGGYEVESIDRELVLISSAPLYRQGWSITIKNAGQVERNVTVTVLAGCFSLPASARKSAPRHR
jgi:hypothetical protein